MLFRIDIKSSWPKFILEIAVAFALSPFLLLFNTGIVHFCIFYFDPADVEYLASLPTAQQQNASTGRLKWRRTIYLLR